MVVPRPAVALEAHAQIEPTLPVFRRGVEQDPFHRPLPHPVGPIDHVERIAQHRTLELLLSSVRGGAGGLALTDDDRIEAGVEVVNPFGFSRAARSRPQPQPKCRQT